MRIQRLVKLAARGIAAAAFLGVACAADPLITDTTSFRIPFDIDQPSGGSPEGSAVLFASVDGGPFEKVQQVEAARRGFQFSAPSDGHYAFAVRLTDASGRVTGDAAVLAPELEVIVDTIAPQLNIQLSESGPGAVSVGWNTDSPVDPSSIRLEFAEGTDGRWTPIEAELNASGTTTLNVSPGTSVSVRGFVSDLAGNEGTGTGQLILSARSASPPSATTDRGVPSAPAPGTNAAPPLGRTPFAQNNTFPAQGAPLTQPRAESVQSYSPAPNNGVRVNPTASQMTLPPPPMQPTTTIPVAPTFPAANGAATEMNYATPTSPQLVKNRVFDIAYQVEDVGPSGVSAVELFVTENGGQQWFRYGKDVDLRTPFQVDTRGEGTFGFAVRVYNGLGFSDPPPQPGDVPSIVVTVDQSPPVIRLGTPQVVATGLGHVALNWQVSDNNPSSTPVRLEYSTSPSGPWTPLFDWQSDQRGFQMPIQSGVSSSMYFRLLARDAAGNIATAQTPQAVIIDQKRPRARLLQVQPASFQQGY